MHPRQKQLDKTIYKVGLKCTFPYVLLWPVYVHHMVDVLAFKSVIFFSGVGDDKKQ